MGKKVKKLVKNTVKVATLGAVDGKDGGWLGGTNGVLNLATLGMAGGQGAKVESGGSESALAQMLLQQQNAATNANVDLSLDNVANVDTGGTAQALGDMSKKKRKQQSLSSSLGINVG